MQLTHNLSVLVFSDCFPDSGQLRHRLRSEMTVVKNRLLKDIATFNSASPTTTIDIGTVERSLSGDGPAVFWPWDVQGSGKRIVHLFCFRLLKCFFLSFKHLSDTITNLETASFQLHTDNYHMEK